jgi:hypothetical protein
MKFFKYLALLALASVPLLLIEKRKRVAAPVINDDNDDIFERELRVD